MPTVSFDLPEDVFSVLRRSPEEFVRALRLAAAIHWYERGEVSQEKAAYIAGLDRTNFLLVLAREQDMVGPPKEQDFLVVPEGQIV